MTNKEAIDELISLQEHCASMMESKHHEPWESDLEALDIAVKALEERPQGEWIMDNEHTENPLLWYKCNLCGVYHSPTNFCPNCGADMRGDKT